MRHIPGTRFRTFLPFSGLLALTALGGCGQLQSGDTDSTAANVMSDNGLRTINGLRNHNGLDPTSGVSLGSGLTTAAGLANATGLMSTADGRTLVSYLVRCALPAGRSITKKDAKGVAYTYTGSLGVAPEWETASCGQSCQMWVSACLLSMVNTTGTHYPIWIDGQPSSVGWGTDPGYPLQEGSFFGNIFTSAAPAYYCEGKDFGVKPIPGRIGGVQDTPPYTDIYGAGIKCTAYCTPADYPHATDGSKACSGFNQVITVWHQ